MTKVIILGNTVENNNKKPIEFIKFMHPDAFIGIPATLPKQYKNIELIRKSNSHYDIMFAYNDDRNSGIIYLGHFNDGIV